MISLSSVRKLNEAKLEFNLFRLDKQAYTVNDVVKYSGGRVKIDEICKTIILIDDDGLGYGILLLGVSKVDLKKINKTLGKKLRLANRKEVTTLTGIDPGAICPIILSMPLLIDKQVLMKNKINFGSGNHLYGIEMNPMDLEKIINYQLIDGSMHSI